MGSLRAGLVGFGVMGRNHARVLSDLEGVELVGVCDPGLPGSGEVLRSLPDLLGLGLDYCVVAAPTVMHEEIGLALADAGVHALIEKPLAADSAASISLAEAFEGRGLVGAVGHIERFNPALRQARVRLDDGLIGPVLQIATRRQGPFPSRISDVGVVKDLASHDIDLTAWLARSSYARVMAAAAHRTGREHEDLVSVTARLADGVIASHLVNWLSPFKERQTVITGERGALVVDTLTADLTFHANGSVATEWDDVARFRGVSEGDLVRYAFPKPEPLRVEHENFRDAVRGREADIVTLREGVDVVRVAEAILSSAATGTSVDL